MGILSLVNLLAVLCHKSLFLGPIFFYLVEKKYYFIQIGDVNFYRFLQKIGLSPNKSRTIGEVEIPEEYFLDFLRGHFDGDGCFYYYWDPRWRSSLMFYTSFVTASQKHVLWLRKRITQALGLKGHITKGKNDKDCYQLKYAKRETLVLLPKLYANPASLYLGRKHLKFKRVLDIMKEISAGGETGRHAILR